MKWVKTKIKYLLQAYLGQVKLITRLAGPARIIKIYTTLPMIFSVLAKQK